MPYIKGDDLATVLRRDGKMPVARALRLARQIAAGLEAAHEAGVVHRDLKPANIMIGADDHALIMDFGISASADEAASGGVVRDARSTWRPSRAAGVAVDARADIYAFGLILYEMLTGPRLDAATTPQERVDAMKQRTDEGLPPVRSLDASVPARSTRSSRDAWSAIRPRGFRPRRTGRGARSRSTTTASRFPSHAARSADASIALASLLVIALLARHVVGRSGSAVRRPRAARAGVGA